MPDLQGVKEFDALTEALEKDASAAMKMDSARRLLVAAARDLDRPERREMHLDLMGSLARLDAARSSLVGSDE